MAQRREPKKAKEEKKLADEKSERPVRVRVHNSWHTTQKEKREWRRGQEHAYRFSRTNW